MQRFSILTLLLTCLYTLPSYANEPDFSHIETIGYGEVTAVPDMAEFTVQIQESTLTAEQAKQRVDKVVTDFIDRLTKEGVKRESINSGNIRLSPKYHYQKDGKSELIGYVASRSITVTVYQLDKLNLYLDGALGDGINRIDNISLKVKDKAHYQALARKAAIEDANGKAKALADGFDVALDGVWKISYDSSPSQPVLYRAMAMDAKEKGSSSYQDASMVIKDSIRVIYKIKD
jgi:uncharacterized protein YggE